MAAADRGHRRRGAFTGVHLAERATRAGYHALAQPISALSLGPGGWVQQLNFIVFGVLVCASAAGWRALLAPGKGALAFPALRVVAGVGLVMDGLFSRTPPGVTRQTCQPGRRLCTGSCTPGSQW